MTNDDELISADSIRETCKVPAVRSKRMNLEESAVELASSCSEERDEPEGVKESTLFAVSLRFQSRASRCYRISMVHGARTISRAASPTRR